MIAFDQRRGSSLANVPTCYTTENQICVRPRPHASSTYAVFSFVVNVGRCSIPSDSKVTDVWIYHTVAEHKDENTSGEFLLPLNCNHFFRGKGNTSLLKFIPPAFNVHSIRIRKYY